LSGPWLESETRVVKLPEDDLVTFNIYLQILYSRNFSSYDDDDYESFKERRYAAYMDLAYVYVLAEKLQNTTVKNDIVRKYLELFNEWGETKGTLCGYYVPCPAVVHIIYSETVEGSPMRRLLVDIWSIEDVSTLIEAQEELPKEFFLDLLIGHQEKCSILGRENRANRKGIEAYLEKE
jgi:hypothetical protein